jgi:integrase
VYSGVLDKIHTLETLSMPKPRAAQLESATARAKLAVAKAPYYVKLAPGIYLGFRRNEGPGTWSVRGTDGHGHAWLKKIGLADDLEPADGRSVLNFWQASELARMIARRQPGDFQDETRPITVAEAIDAYERDLKARGGSVENANRVRFHLGALGSKPVVLLGSAELTRWRDGLTAKGLAAASVNRTINALKAAFGLAAKHDARIANRRAWQEGLERLPDAETPRNVILDDDTVRRVIAGAYARDWHFGLFVHTVSETGSRPGQLARLRVEDLRLDPGKPTLRVPRSAKGGSRQRAERRNQRTPVPITGVLATRLAQEAAGRLPDAPLLTQDGVRGWGSDPNQCYRKAFAAVAAAAGLPPATTLYCLRHSFVVRNLLRGVPLRVIAATVDSSASMLERHYSAFIADHTDQLTRAALLEPAELVPPAGR